MACIALFKCEEILYEVRIIHQFMRRLNKKGQNNYGQIIGLDIKGLERMFGSARAMRN